MRYRSIAVWLCAAIWLWGGLTSCGSVGLRSDASGGTGGSTGSVDAGATDGGDDAPAIDDGGGNDVICSPTRSFSAPLLVPGLSQAGTTYGSARFSADELTVYFGSQRPADAGGTGNYDIFTATRNSRSAAFGVARAFTVTNSATASDYDAVLTADGQTLYFGSSRTQIDRVYVSLFNAITSNFSPPAVIESISQAADAGTSAAGTLDAFQPYVLPDNTVLYFGSARAGSRDIYRSTRATAGFARPTAIAEVNTPSVEQFPTVSADELVIYWASNRPDGGARGGSDVWMATRASTTDPFTGLRDVAEVNTTLDDSPAWISPDGCRLYLTSRASVYVAERTP
jgi:WD40-like Beta Propeller Repeat